MSKQEGRVARLEISQLFIQVAKEVSKAVELFFWSAAAAALAAAAPV
jgi:hypothetical protein